jgi:hypothetical protein
MEDSVMQPATVIRQQTVVNLTRYRGAPRESIDRRLEDLEREWDVERALEANAAAVGLTGLGLGIFVDRRFLLLPVIASGFLLQHALQGWCPPLPILRRFGFRTQKEIEAERRVLRRLRSARVAAEHVHA